jgi:hypothetical protein
MLTKVIVFFLVHKYCLFLFTAEGTIKERSSRNTGNSRLKTKSEDKQNKRIITKKYKNQTKQTNKQTKQKVKLRLIKKRVSG